MKRKNTAFKRSHRTAATRRKRMMTNNHKKVLWRQRAAFVAASED
ncbi:hypothetical protein [Thaumasiovibrio subtropicus]|nr:hypothetical protein [Thaumasiovibrio subtropicus]